MNNEHNFTISGKLRTDGWNNVGDVVIWLREACEEITEYAEIDSCKVEIVPGSGEMHEVKP